MTMIIDMSGKVLGRIATVIAKRALLGEDISVINCEKAVISGDKGCLVAWISKKMRMGQPQQGPYLSAKPNLFVRRIIRGMLPFKTPHGKQAFHRVKCYVGIPEALAKEKVEKIKEYDGSSINAKYFTVGEICGIVGGKK